VPLGAGACSGVSVRLGVWLNPGSQGESAACRLLEQRGYRVLARNFRCRGGEIDIVAQDGEALVFVEVKQRSGASHGTGCEAVTHEKRRRIIQAARLFAARRGLSERPIRFDVVALDGDPQGVVHARHIQGAFDARGK
jgi:putative endonuclease